MRFPKDIILTKNAYKSKATSNQFSPTRRGKDKIATQGNEGVSLKEWIQQMIDTGIITVSNNITGIVLTSVDGNPDSLTASLTKTIGPDLVSNTINTLDNQDASNVTTTGSLTIGGVLYPAGTTTQAVLTALTSTNNIYVTDGTLTGARTLTGAGNNLSFTDVPNFLAQATSSARVITQSGDNQSGTTSVFGNSSLIYAQNTVVGHEHYVITSLVDNAISFTGEVTFVPYSYSFPTYNATAGQVLQNDGIGGIDWVDPSSLGYLTDANNGLSLSGSIAQLGGTLIKDTSITNTGNFDLTFDIGSAGTTPHLEIKSNVNDNKFSSYWSDYGFSHFAWSTLGLTQGSISVTPNGYTGIIAQDSTASPAIILNALEVDAAYVKLQSNISNAPTPAIAEYFEVKLDTATSIINIGQSPSAYPLQNTLAWQLTVDEVAGTLGQVLTTDAAGKPSWQTPSSGNIYTADGTLTGNRIVTGDGFNVDWVMSSPSATATKEWRPTWERDTYTTGAGYTTVQLLEDDHFRRTTSLATFNSYFDQSAFVIEQRMNTATAQSGTILGGTTNEFYSEVGDRSLLKTIGGLSLQMLVENVSGTEAEILIVQNGTATDIQLKSTAIQSATASVNDVWTLTNATTGAGEWAPAGGGNYAENNLTADADRSHTWTTFNQTETFTSGDFKIANTGSTGAFFIDGPTARIGMNTINPQSLLSVSGNMAIGSGYAGIFAASTDGLIVQGNTGIGVTIATEKLHVVGNIRYSGALKPNNLAGTAGYLLTSSGGGANTWTDPATLGGGSIGGSITDNQIAVGALTANEIEGDAAFTYDAASDLVTLGDNTGNTEIRLSKLETGTSKISFYNAGVEEGYISFDASETLDISAFGTGYLQTSGTDRFWWSSDRFRGNFGSAGGIMNENGSLTNPTLIPNNDDLGTGVGGTGASLQVALISNSKTALVTSDAGTVTNTEIGGSVQDFGGTISGEGVLRLNDVTTVPTGILASGGLLYVTGTDIRFLDDAGTDSSLLGGSNYANAALVATGSYNHSWAANNLTETFTTGDYTLANSGNANALFIDGATGFVGMGTNAPGHTLSVNGDIAVSNFIYALNDTNTYIRFPASDQMTITVGAEEAIDILEGFAGSYINMSVGGEYDFSVGTNSLYVGGSDFATYNGLVGIGTNTPSGDLTIGDGLGSPEIHLQKTEAGTSKIAFYNAGVEEGYIEQDATENLNINALSIGYLRVNGSNNFRWQSGLFGGNLSTSAAVLNESGSLTNPTLIPNRATTSTGVGGTGSSLQVALISNSKPALVTSDAGTVTNVELNGSVQDFGGTISGEGVLRLNDVTTVPTGILASGGLVYVTGTDLRFLDDAGTDSSLLGGASYLSQVGLNTYVTDLTQSFGIGTTTPNNILEVTTAAANDGIDIVTDAGNDVFTFRNSNSSAFPVAKIEMNYGLSTTHLINAASSSIDFISKGGNLNFYSNIGAGQKGIAYMTLSGVGIGLTATSPSRELHVITDDATTNTIVPTLRLSKTSSGTPAIGIGTGIEFEVETTASNNEILGTITTEATVVTATSEEAKMSFNLMTAGAAATPKLEVTVNEVENHVGTANTATITDSSTGTQNDFAPSSLADFTSTYWITLNAASALTITGLDATNAQQGTEKAFFINTAQTVTFKDSDVLSASTNRILGPANADIIPTLYSVVVFAYNANEAKWILKSMS